MASQPIVYQRKPKEASKIGTSMEEEEEVKKQSSEGPHTPAKQIPNKTHKTYSRKPGEKKNNNSLPSNPSSSSASASEDVSTITDSSEKSNEAKKPLLPDLNIIPCPEEPPNKFSQETNNSLGSEITETIAVVGDLAIATEEEKEGDISKFVLVYADRLLPSFNSFNNSTESPESVSPCDNDQSNEERKIPAADPLSAVGSQSSVASKKSQHNLKKRPNNDVDLDKRPRKKPKKKIHRPKVVGEGKPRRTTLAPKTPTKRAPKPEKPKPAAAKKRISLKKNMSGKRKNMKNLENSDTPLEEVFVEQTDPDPAAGGLSISLNVPNHSTDENTSTVVTRLQRQQNGCEMPGSIIPLCERSDLCQAVLEGPVKDCSTNQSVCMEEYQNHCGENDYLGFPKNLQKLRSKRRPRSEWKALVIGVNKASKKSMVGRRNYETRLSIRIETALLNELKSVSHPKKKRTRRCIARRNLDFSNASTILNQLLIAPFGEALEALANGRHGIEVPQMDEANKEALFAEERVTEKQIEEHKNLQHGDKSRDSEERCIGGESAEIIPSHLYTQFLIEESPPQQEDFEFHIRLIEESPSQQEDFEFHIGLIEESPPQQEDFVFAGKSIGDYKELHPLEHDKPYLTTNSIDMNDISEGGLLDVFPSEYGALVPCQILQDQNVDFSQASQHNGQSDGVKKKPGKNNADTPQASNGAIVPHNGQSAIVKQKTKNKLKYDPRFKKMWKFQLDYLTDESEERKKFWESERTMFKGRIDAFTARMHQILGDRRFSPWKGSVLDSVIGVFLTQNVSDILSSSAFISLAARFPAQPSSHEDPIIDFSEESVGSNTEYLGPAYTLEECETAGVVNLADNDMHEIKVISTCLSEDCSTEAKVDMHPQNNGSKDGMTVSELKNLVDEMIQKENNLQAAGDANSADQERQKGESSNIKEQQPSERKQATQRKSKKVAEKEKVKTDWDALRKTYCTGEQRRRYHMDSVDWEAVRHAKETVIANAIEGRGQHNILARRIKECLNRVVELHNCLDLEWLRHAPPDKVKEYLLDFNGLGLKSVECIRLLELQNVAFPVDTNVGRIAVRLGWVPLQPLPERLQIHLLQQLPLMDSIQKYLWPRLKEFDHKTLYELHYHLITFGKVFCQKTKPSCNNCPMKAECRHYASEYASARAALPGPTNTSKASRTAPIVAFNHPGPTLYPTSPFLLEANWFSASQHQKQNVEPIIEVPPSPSPAASQHQKQNVEPIIEVPPSPSPASCEPEFPNLDDIEDSGFDDPDGMPTINLSTQESTGPMSSWSVMLHDDDVPSRDLVLLSAEAASMPVPKLKHASRLRTKHEVYELPDHHPLLIGFERRDANDPYPYLLSIRAPGESSMSSQPCRTPGEPCSSNSTEQNHHTVDGSILIPCRTAMRGSFPLNGTYFQVNEVFLDYKTSLEPIQVPRGWIWNLQRRTAYFGTSATSIFRGLATEEIQHCFWAGFICLRSFDRIQRCPKPLGREFHITTTQQSGKAKINEEDDE